jgi:hypothetical protein
MTLATRLMHNLTRHLTASPGRRHAVLLAALLAAAPLQALRAASNDISAAERALFMAQAFPNQKAATTLKYSFKRSGTLDAPFTDDVTLRLANKPAGGCCSASVSFLTGEHALKLPDLDGVEGNPVLLGFLEHDITEMERATGGKKNYFRKRIRMALAETAKLTPRTLRYQGRDVAGTEISIAPYDDDPLKGRYERLAGKRYAFFTAASVPGKLLGIRTVVPAAAAQDAPLASTELWLNGAEPVAP